VPCSLSSRWNVARLTSVISSSLRTKRCSDQLLSDCWISAVGSVDADALPTSESPSAVAAAALVVLFSLAACFIRAMVVSLDTLLGSVDMTGVPVPPTNARRRRRSCSRERASSTLLSRGTHESFAQTRSNNHLRQHSRRRSAKWRKSQITNELVSDR
jgi:hypothetical protein